MILDLMYNKLTYSFIYNTCMYIYLLCHNVTLSYNIYIYHLDSVTDCMTLYNIRLKLNNVISKQSRTKREKSAQNM